LLAVWRELLAVWRELLAVWRELLAVWRELLAVRREVAPGAVSGGRCCRSRRLRERFPSEIRLLRFQLVRPG
jgi:hypothetical protein